MEHASRFLNCKWSYLPTTCKTPLLCRWKSQRPFWQIMELFISPLQIHKCLYFLLFSFSFSLLSFLSLSHCHSSHLLSWGKRWLQWGKWREPYIEAEGKITNKLKAFGEEMQEHYMLLTVLEKNPQDPHKRAKLSQRYYRDSTELNSNN